MKLSPIDRYILERALAFARDSAVDGEFKLRLGSTDALVALEQLRTRVVNAEDIELVNEPEKV